MSAYAMRMATSRSLEHMREIQKLADDMRNDPQAEQRLARHYCLPCFYIPTVGGAAMTTQPCMSCGRDQVYNSTSTDVLCEPCARAAGLCKRCGADSRLRERRRDWPDPITQAKLPHSS